MVAWFEGAGEKATSDVKIMASQKINDKWSTPCVLEGTPNLPDINPVLFVDNNDIWLFYYTPIHNTWQSSIMKYKKGVWVNGAIQWGAVKELPIDLENNAFDTDFNACLQEQLKASRPDIVQNLDYEDLIIPINATHQLRFTIDTTVEKWITHGVYGALWSAYGEYLTSLGLGCTIVN